MKWAQPLVWCQVSQSLRPCEDQGADIGAEVSHDSNKEEHKSRSGAAGDTAACLLIQVWTDGGNWLGMRFLPAKPLIAMSLQPDKRLFNLTAVFPAQNGYLRPDAWETTSHLSQGDIRSLQQITQSSAALGKEPQGLCGKWGQKYSGPHP